MRDFPPHPALIEVLEVAFRGQSVRFVPLFLLPFPSFFASTSLRSSARSGGHRFPCGSCSPSSHFSPPCSRDSRLTRAVLFSRRSVSDRGTPNPFGAGADSNDSPPFPGRARSLDPFLGPRDSSCTLPLFKRCLALLSPLNPAGPSFFYGREVRSHFPTVCSDERNDVFFPPGFLSLRCVAVSFPCKDSLELMAIPVRASSLSLFFPQPSAARTSLLRLFNKLEFFPGFRLMVSRR